MMKKSSGVYVLILLALSGPFFVEADSQLESMSAELDASSCSDCLWKYSGEEYYNCINQYCSEIVTQQVLFNEISNNAQCNSCKNLEEPAFKLCAFSNCQELILSKTEEFVVKFPYILASHKPYIEMPCRSCLHYMGASTLSYDCAYYNCRKESFNALPSTTLTDSKCGTCLKYSNSEYLNCAYFFCRSEIMNLLSSHFNLNEPLKLSNCTDQCYYDWYYFQHDYSTCVRLNCKSSNAAKSEFSLIDSSSINFLTNCDACYYYYTGSKLNDCTNHYCLSELLVKQNNFLDVELPASCYDCSQYWETENFNSCVESNCKQFISAKLNKYFEEKISLAKLRPQSKLEACDQCYVLYTDDERLFDCLSLYCEEGSGFLKAYEQKMNLFEQCQDCKGCQGGGCTKGNSQVEINYISEKYLIVFTMNTFKEETVQFYKMYSADKGLLTNTEPEGCYICFEPEQDSYGCFWVMCASLITNREKLFESAPDSTDLCASCYYSSIVDYTYCAYVNCKEKVLQKAKELAIYNSELLKNKKGFKSYSCGECLHQSSDSAVYDCAFYNCRSEFLNRNSLSNNYLSSSCQDCLSYDDDAEIVICTYFYCRNEITQSLQLLSSGSINLNPCTDSCYYDWYYYQYEYHTCVYEYCKNDASVEFSPKVPKMLSSTNSVLDCVDTCKWKSKSDNDLVACAWSNCKKDIKAMVLSGNSGSDCGNCVKASEGDSLEICTLIYCINEVKELVSGEAKKSDFVTKHSEILVSHCTQCFLLYSKASQYDCSNFYCKGPILEAIQADFYKTYTTLQAKSYKRSKCDECYYNYYTGSSTWSDYNKCSSIHCKNEFYQISTNLQEQSFGRSKCDDCYYSYYVGSSTWSEYNKCSSINCKGFEVEVLLDNSKRSKCDDCYYKYYVGATTWNEYNSCASKNCKQEIAKVIESFSIQSASLVSDKKPSADDCWDAFYKENYDFKYYVCYQLYSMNEAEDSRSYGGMFVLLLVTLAAAIGIYLYRRSERKLANSLPGESQVDYLSLN